MTDVLKGKYALVCGGSEGIGRSTAIRLAGSGATVTILARKEESLLSVLKEMPGTGHDYIIADLDETEHLKHMIDSKIRSGKNWHILINNTGGPKPGGLLDATPDDFLNAFKRHVISAQVLSQKIIPFMKAEGFGRIVNVLSTSVKEPIPNLGVSNTIRGAMASWSKTLSKEVAGNGITVNNILPGYTKTGRLKSLIDSISKSSGKDVQTIEKGFFDVIPLKRFAEPEELAEAVNFLCSPLSGYITGVNLPVDGGRILTF